MVRRVLGSSRYLIIIAVVSIFLAATALLIFGAIDLVYIVSGLLHDGVSEKIAKQLVVNFIELIDIFLLATVMYVTAIGLYELFIDDTLPLPDWLEIHDLDDLKNKLVAVVIVVMGVAFLGQVVSWNGQSDILSFGGAIALVGAMLTYFLSQKNKTDKSDKLDKGEK